MKKGPDPGRPDPLVAVFAYAGALYVEKNYQSQGPLLVEIVF